MRNSTKNSENRAIKKLFAVPINYGIIVMLKGGRGLFIDILGMKVSSETRVLIPPASLFRSVGGGEPQ